MKKLRILHVVFNSTIEAYEIPAFRAGVAEKVGFENVLFHNHKNDDEFIYNYPLIQYMRVGRKPSILCIEDGVEEIYKLFIHKNWNINMAGRDLVMEVSSLNLKDYTLRITKDRLHYRISNWLALNQTNYKEFEGIESLTDRIEKLERILAANILSFAKGIEWVIEKPIEIKITKLSPFKLLKYKGVLLSGFDAEFTVNVFLPNYMGLGKGVSHGFGTIKQLD